MPPEATAIINATCLAGRELEPLRDSVIVLAGEAIRAVGSAADVKPPPGAVVVDARGLTLVPGFIDAHVHIGLADPRAVVAGGVTTVRDLGWPPARIWPLVGRSQSPAFEGPSIVAAGQILTAPGGYPARAGWAPEATALEVDGLHSARDAVRRTAEAGACAIKVALDPSAGPTLESRVLRTIVDAAHERGLGVAAHVSGLDQLEVALACGVDELAHMLLSRQTIPRRLMERMVSQEMRIVPTLATFFGRGRRIALSNLRGFVRAGGCVVYGTDLGNAGPRPGIDRREVTGMLAAGMASRDVLASATVVAAKWTGVARAGSIEEGNVADIVAVEGDPLRDARAVTNVRLVWRRGRQLSTTGRARP
jgi:imidazolonepropionase-like amidohydrolase